MKKNLTKSIFMIVFLFLASTIGFSTAFGYGGSSGGSSFGINLTTSCVSVTYGEWGSCVNGFQYRNVLEQNPAFCSLTTAQQLARSKSCGVAEEIISEEAEEVASIENSLDVAAIMATERNLVATVNRQLTNRLSGRILLQVEENGMAWYLEPTSQERHFMGRPYDAFAMMRRFGLGISEVNFSKFETEGVPSRFAGRIFLRTESHGEAYYVNPVDMQMYYLGRPADAFNLMRELSLGISNNNIRQISVGEVK